VAQPRDAGLWVRTGCQALEWTQAYQ
jgi:hypothetical protein